MTQHELKTMASLRYDGVGDALQERLTYVHQNIGDLQLSLVQQGFADAFRKYEAADEKFVVEVVRGDSGIRVDIQTTPAYRVEAGLLARGLKQQSGFMETENTAARIYDAVERGLGSLVESFTRTLDEIIPQTRHTKAVREASQDENAVTGQYTHSALERLYDLVDVFLSGLGVKKGDSITFFEAVDKAFAAYARESTTIGTPALGTEWNPILLTAEMKKRETDKPILSSSYALTPEEGTFLFPEINWSDTGTAVLRGYVPLPRFSAPVVESTQGDPAKDVPTEKIDPKDPTVIESLEGRI